MGAQYYVPGGVTTGEDIDLSTLQVLGSIGGGGQGRVYELGNSGTLVYKGYYDPGRINDAAMTRLVRLRQQLPPADRRWVDAHFAWPMCRVVTAGWVVGFVMRRASAAYSWQDAAGYPHLTELQYLIRLPKPPWRQITQPTPAQRRRLAWALAEMTQRLHRLNVVIGDISDANLLWTVKPQPDMYVLDCDGLRIRGEAPILKQADTPGWTDPFQRSRVPGQDADLYKTALAIARILARHPEVAPGEALYFVDGSLGDREARVRRLLSQAAGPPGTRPEAALWAAALADERRRRPGSADGHPLRAPR
jgi:hypothetical protein